MLGVDTLVGNVVRQIMQQMTDIMQQGGDDHGWGRTIALRAKGALQGMVELVHPFAIAVLPALVEGRANGAHRVHAATPFFSLRRRRSTRARLSSPSLST